MNNQGRLAYWKAKADLCHELFQQQVEDKDKRGEAVKNLERFIHAKNMEATLLAGQDMSWLLPEGNDAA
jgi:hypothetical protein